MWEKVKVKKYCGTPDLIGAEVRLIAEYPTYYVFERVTDTGCYTFTIHKADLKCGDCEVVKC